MGSHLWGPWDRKDSDMTEHIHPVSIMGAERLEPEAGPGTIRICVYLADLRRMYLHDPRQSTWSPQSRQEPRKGPQFPFFI